MKSKMICIIAIIVSVVIVLVLAYFIGTGFMVRTDVVLADFSVSEDGTILTLKTTIPTSMGYIRCYKKEGGGVKPHYLTFYSTFGGLNSSFGAKNEFELELGEDDTEIYFNRPDGGYTLVLQKNTETGEWYNPSNVAQGIEDEEEQYEVAVDWSDFIKLNGITYRGDWRETEVPQELIGEKIGTVTKGEPKVYADKDGTVHGLIAEDGSSYCCKIGTELFAVVDNENAIAALVDGKYYLYTAD